MTGPEILIDIEKIKANSRNIVNFCRIRSIAVTGVTKVTCGMPLVGRAMLEGGVTSLGESRIENIRRMRNSGINAPMMMLRIPPLSQVKEIVSLTDVSLNSELSVIKSLSRAALERGKIHKIILMVDLGDLREGIWPSDLMEITREVLTLKGVRIMGIGTNLTCFGGVLPTEKNMNQLVGYAEKMEQTFNIDLDIISGGNSSSLPLLARGGVPRRINHLRIGEAILLGRETVKGTLWPGCSDETFQLSAEVIELKKKPSLPIGETGCDAFGKKPVFSDKGDIIRAILSVGREDVIVDNLKPRDKKISLLGASSDHLLLDVTEAERKTEVGDYLSFQMNYGALLAAMTSNYVQKTPLIRNESSMKPKKIIMAGDSPLFKSTNMLNHLKKMNFPYEITGEEITEKLINEICREKSIPFIGGEKNGTTPSLKGICRNYQQLGLIIFSPWASLTDEKEENLSFLARTMGYKDEDDDLTAKISPESTVLIGLREADELEIMRIKTLGLQVYTMEDVDLLGMREIMINSLRKITTGTEGFYTRISSDVINADGEGLTFREAHLAMEMIADTKQMAALDISGTPDKSWINDRALSSIVESAFGKRILQRTSFPKN